MPTRGSVIHTWSKDATASNFPSLRAPSPAPGPSGRNSRTAPCPYRSGNVPDLLIHQGLHFPIRNLLHGHRHFLRFHRPADRADILAQAELVDHQVGHAFERMAERPRCGRSSTPQNYTGCVDVLGHFLVPLGIIHQGGDHPERAADAQQGEVISGTPAMPELTMIRSKSASSGRNPICWVFHTTTGAVVLRKQRVGTVPLV